MVRTQQCGSCGGSGAAGAIEYGVFGGLSEGNCGDCYGTGRREVPVVRCENCGVPGAVPAMGAGNLCDDCDLDRPTAHVSSVTAQEAARACLHGGAS